MMAEAMQTSSDSSFNSNIVSDEAINSSWNTFQTGVKIIFINPQDKFLQMAGDRPPLGLAYLSSFVEKNGYKSVIFDLNHDSKLDMLNYIQYSLEDLREKVFACLSVSTPNYKQCLEIAREIKKINKDIIVIAGGNHVTDIVEKLTLETYDYVIRGEGEVGLLKVVSGGVNEKVVQSMPIEDLDSLPMPNYKQLFMERYTMTVDGLPGAIVLSSRGCRNACNFCGSSKLRRWRGRSPENVIEELRVLYYQYGKRGFYFADDIFSPDKERVKRLCTLMKKEFPDIKWRATTRADLLNEDLIVAMRDAGCTIVSLGFEDANDEVLLKIHKGMKVKDQLDVIELCRKHGMKVKLFIIFGLSGQTWEHGLNTIKVVKEQVAKGGIFADAYVYIPLPGTFSTRFPDRYGLEIDPWPEDGSWDDYYQIGSSGLPPKLHFKHDKLTHEQIYALHNLFKKEIGNIGLTY